MTHGKTYNKSPRRINHKATKSKTNTGTTALERSVEQATEGFKALLQLANFTLGPYATLNTEIHKISVRIKAPNSVNASKRKHKKSKSGNDQIITIEGLNCITINLSTSNFKHKATILFNPFSVDSSTTIIWTGLFAI